MDNSYILLAERGSSGQLRIGYPSKELAVSAAEAMALHWETITITGPDGALVLKMEAARA